MSAHRQHGDVLLEAPLEFGIAVVNGLVCMTGSFETAAALSLFGGNFDDDGSPGNAEQYWGNLMEVDPAREYHSRTQFLIDGIPATSGNLLRVKAAAEADLAWFLALDIADAVTVGVFMPALNTVRIDIAITARGEECRFSFTRNWKAS